MGKLHTKIPFSQVFFLSSLDDLIPSWWNWQRHCITERQQLVAVKILFQLFLLCLHSLELRMILVVSCVGKKCSYKKDKLPWEFPKQLHWSQSEYTGVRCIPKASHMLWGMTNFSRFKPFRQSTSCSRVCLRIIN